MPSKLGQLVCRVARVQEQPHSLLEIMQCERVKCQPLEKVLENELVASKIATPWFPS